MMKTDCCKNPTGQSHLSAPAATQGHQKVLRHGGINTLCHTEHIHHATLVLIASAYMRSHKSRLISLWFHLALGSIWAEKQQNKECDRWSREVHQALIHRWTNCTNSIKRRETRKSGSCSGTAWQPDVSVEINFDPWMSQLLLLHTGACTYSAWEICYYCSEHSKIV